MDRWKVSFSGNSLTDRNTVETYLLYRAAELTDQQLQYAASDVLHLHEIRERLIRMLEREGRLELAQACFEFLPVRADLDLLGWEDTDIFAHS